MNTIRKIIHIDMDAFFASVEQRDSPEYRNKPLIVGGEPDKRGVVAACSYEARKFGIHSAMPSATAYRLCPEAIFVRPRIDVYREVSDQLRAIFRCYTELVEPLSLDEAYLDVSESELFKGSATLIAKDIKAQIKHTTDLTASAGISYNKFLAKIASDMDKPDGIYLITPDQGPPFVEQLPIKKFYGIGKATEAKMQKLGIKSGADLKNWEKAHLVQHFGKVGTHYYNIARGVDNRPVQNTRERKSLGTERTYEHDLDKLDEITKNLHSLAEKTAISLQEKHLSAKTLTLKVKYDNFEQITRSFTAETYLQSIDDMLPLIPQLLEKTDVGERKVRLLGVSVSNLIELDKKEKLDQLDLFIQ